MDPLLEHKELIHYLPSGKPVCYEHRFHVCPYCCLDFTYNETDEENEEEEEDQEDSPPDNPVLSGQVARFIPQWDKQIISPENVISIKKDYANLPKPSSIRSLNLHACQSCHFT